MMMAIALHIPADEQSLPAEEIDELFEQQAQRQYQRELLFSTIVNLMSLVVGGIALSVNAAYQAKAKGIIKNDVFCPRMMC